METEKIDKPFSYIHNAKLKADSLFSELHELNQLIVNGGLQAQLSNDQINEIREAYATSRNLTEKIERIRLEVKGSLSTRADLGGVNPDDTSAEVPRPSAVEELTSAEQTGDH